MTFKVVSVVGARPQFIKMAPVSRALRAHCVEVIVHTGQHYDDRMSQIFFDELAIPQPDYDLGVGSGSHAQQTGDMLVRTEQVLLKEKPNGMLVFGDTNSTLAGALAAAKLNIPVAHVEAGLRSFNRTMPEEINRILTDHLSALLFCPTATAVNHLQHEGITRGVHLVGDVMYDALLENSKRADRQSLILSTLGVSPQKYLLGTIHRPSNTDDPASLRAILDAFSQIDETIVFPLHPRTQKAIATWQIAITPNIRLIEPAGYLDMLMLEKNARLILTDAGGVQKEAYLFGVPCITLRDETEWVETVAHGWNCLVGNQREKILDAVKNFVTPASRPALFGDGHASEKIVEKIKQW